jgi:hypothetical protein
MEAEIGFTWWRERNSRDYEEINAMAPVPPTSFVDYVLNDNVHRIVAKGVRFEAYRPLEKFPKLFEQFAEVQSQQDAVKFVRTFGPLTDDGKPGGKGDDVHKVLVLAHAMAAGPLHIDLVPVCSLNARLVAEPDGLHLRIEPANLLEALWLQFADAVKRDQAHRCRQCNALFATGPDAKRRRGAEFCSIECKIKFHSLKRSR